jgi:hypothetical protein
MSLWQYVTMVNRLHGQKYLIFKYVMVANMPQWQIKIDDGESEQHMSQ